jgi:hypothetical protein
MNKPAPTPIAGVTPQTARDYMDRNPPGMDAWQQSVMAGFARLDAGHAALVLAFDRMKEDNESQHGELSVQVAVISGDVKALQAGLVASLADVKSKLTSKNKAIRALEIVIIVLLAMVIESKAHLIELLKALAAG